MRDDESGLPDLGDDVGDREGLPRAGDAEQHLLAVAALDSLDQLGNRLRLIAFGLVVGDEMEARSRLGGHESSRPFDERPLYPA